MQIANFVIKLAQKAGDLVLKTAKNHLEITKKAKKDLVTNVDKMVEKFLIENILKKYPKHAILAEESSFISKTPLEQLAKSEYIWIIDPIDGTSNFAHGLKEYAISIALFRTISAKSSKNFKFLNGELILGIVYLPAMDELFYAEKNQGSYLNGKKIKVSKTSKLEDALLATGFTHIKHRQNLPYFSAMIDECHAIRRLGAASIDLCYTACGRFDAYWEFNLNPWDIAAGALIAKEAGGKVSDTNGNLLDLFGKDILVSNGKIHEEMIKIFRKIHA